MKSHEQKATTSNTPHSRGRSPLTAHIIDTRRGRGDEKKVTRRTSVDGFYDPSYVGFKVAYARRARYTLYLPMSRNPPGRLSFATTSSMISLIRPFAVLMHRSLGPSMSKNSFRSPGGTGLFGA